MICVQRVQRFMMAIMILLSLVLMQLGYMLVAKAILVFMVLMICVWASFNVCPSISVLKKFLPDCKFGDN